MYKKIYYLLYGIIFASQMFMQTHIFKNIIKNFLKY